jgi:hypothetical protein
MGAEAEIELNLYLQHCDRLEFPDQKILVLNASQEVVGEGLCRATEKVSHWLTSEGWERVFLFYPGCNGEPYEFDGSFAHTLTTASASPNQSDSSNFQATMPVGLSVDGPKIPLVIPELGLDFNGIWFNADPILFYAFEDGQITFANIKAQEAQQKTLQQLQRDTGHSLNFSEEYERRVERVWGGERLREYENSGMRFYRDPETGFYRRKQMQFVSNAGRINFGGMECWYSHTTHAMETGRIAA